MTKPQTEALHAASEGLDARPLTEIAEILAAGQIAAAEVVRAAEAQITQVAELMANSISSHARLHYIAAGSSGLMAAADAQELGGTFSTNNAGLQVYLGAFGAKK